MTVTKALGMFLSILRGSSSVLRDGFVLHVEREEYEKARQAYNAELTYPSLPWRPIAELADKYENELLLLAPELVDLDCNPSGVGMGYWQDGRDVPTNKDGAIWKEGVDYGGFLACKWSMTNDEWYEVACTPTHYLKLTGVRT